MFKLRRVRAAIAASAAALAACLYVALPSGGGGTCSSGDPWPGTEGDEVVCPDDIEAQILAQTGKTVVAPTPPTLPSGTVTVYSGTAADSIAEVRNAIVNDSGLAHVILGGNLTGGALRLHSGGVGAQDAVIDLNGHTIDALWCGDESAGGNAARIVLMNGHIESVLFWKGGGGTGTNRCDDIIWHGVSIGTGELQVQSGVPCDRWSFTSTLGAGVDGTSGGAIATLADCTNVMIANSNWEGGSAPVGDANNWILRFGFNTQKIWLINLRGRGWHKPIVRGNGGELIAYTTDDCLGQSCAGFLVNTGAGNQIRAVSDGINGIDIEMFAVLRQLIVMGNTASSGNLWGPEDDTDVAWWGGNHWCATNSGIIDGTDLTDREAAEGEDSYDLDETYAGTATSFTYESTVEDCVPAWPTVTAPEIDGLTVAGSDVGVIGDDPD